MLKLKMQQHLGTQVGLRSLVYRLMHLQTKPILKNKFVKLPRIFYIKIDILWCAYIKLNCLKKKYQENVEECIFDS